MLILFSRALSIVSLYHAREHPLACNGSHFVAIANELTNLWKIVALDIHLYCLYLKAPAIIIRLSISYFSMAS